MELRFSDSTSIKYHNIFDFKLTKDELFKWQLKNEKVNILGVSNKKGKKRIERERYSAKKLKIAKDAAKTMSLIPTVLFVGITGSLAMMNAKKDSDIDLLIITKQNTLWITRLLVYLVLKIQNYELRDPKQKKEKDKLCLNMWLDETDLVWNKKDRNIYTAHEIAQVVPLVNKNKTYDKFLYLNKWILNYWPNVVVINGRNDTTTKVDKNNLLIKILNLTNLFFYKLQYLYMKNKITKEIVTTTKAIFHPNDWSKIVESKLVK